MDEQERDKLLRVDNFNGWLIRRLVVRLAEGAGLGVLGGFACFRGLGIYGIDMTVAVISGPLALFVILVDLRFAGDILKERKNIDGILKGSLWESIKAVVIVGLSVLFMFYAYFGGFYTFKPQ